jgi:hypothetical protein
LDGGRCILTDASCLQAVVDAAQQLLLRQRVNRDVSDSRGNASSVHGRFVAWLLRLCIERLFC